MAAERRRVLIFSARHRVCRTQQIQFCQKLATDVLPFQSLAEILSKAYNRRVLADGLINVFAFKQVKSNKCFTW